MIKGGVKIRRADGTLEKLQKRSSGAGLMFLSIFSTIIKVGCYCIAVYITLWCLDHFGILDRILWVAE